MHRLIFLFILSIIRLTAPAQTSVRPTMPRNLLPKESTVYYKLGERVIQIKTFQYGDVKNMVYVNLHDDEITAVNGARKVLEKRGGMLIKIENYRTRNIKFKLEGKYYTIDPNRMFSRVGIAKSLMVFGRTSPKAIDEIEKFANRILQLIPANPYWIIALHNNSNGKYSINSYLPGGDKEKDAKALNVNQELDADNFFLTTDSLLFRQLSTEQFNMIWQDNEKAKRDGSLSIYCGEKNIHYVNCETENGSQPEYDEMIIAANNLIEGKKTDSFITKKKTDPVIDKKNTDSVSSKQNPNEMPRAAANRIKGKNSDSVVITKKADPVIFKKIPDIVSSKQNPVIAPVKQTTGIVTNKNNTGIIAYSYRIIPTSGHLSPKTNTEIFFGERKVGIVTSVVTDSSWTIAGKLEMNKDFPLYSNMDLFLVLTPTSPPRIEVRVDPTRKKELLNPVTAAVLISAKNSN
jgi:hypothetical protein